MTASISASMSPYPGLRPFRRDESDLFFGRGTQIADMLQRLETHRFLAVVGASGCGKSSLVLAGLIPALEEGYLATTLVGEPWVMVVVRPGDAPLRNLASELVRQLRPNLEAEEHAFQTALVLAALRSGPKGLVNVINGARLPDGTHVLILVDQFEELFRFRQQRSAEPEDNGAVLTQNDDNATLVSLLLATAKQDDRPVYVVITMRSDFMGDCDTFHGLPEAINDSQFLTPRLTRDQAQDSIVEPARINGSEVEPALVNRILNEIGNKPDQLPLMQHVLMRLWDQASRTVRGTSAITLRLDQYEKHGGLSGALDKHGEEVFTTQLSAEQQQIAEVLFRSLSDRGQSSARTGARDTRRPTTVQEIAKIAGVPEEQIIAVANLLRAPGTSFLTPPLDVDLTPQKRLDIAHESLLRGWNRLKEWVELEAKSAEIYRRLSERAIEWRDQRADYLDRLQMGFLLDWKKHKQPTPAWAQRYEGNFELAMRFLNESEAAEKRRVDQIKQAEDERLESERETRKKKQKIRYMSYLIGVGVVSLSVTMGLASYAYYLYNKATAAVEELDSSEKAAQETSKKLAISEADATFRLTQAQENVRQANVHRLIEVSRQATQRGNPVNGVLFAEEAYKLANAKENKGVIGWTAIRADAERNLRDSLTKIGGLGFHADVGDITSVAAFEHMTKKDKHELKWLAAAGTNGTIALWNLTEPNACKAKILDFGFESFVRQLLFTRDGKYLIAHSGNASSLPYPASTGSAHYYVTIWELAKPDADPRVFKAFPYIDVSPDSRWLQTNNGANQGKFIAIPSGAEQAIIFDTLRETDPKQKVFDRTFARGFAFSRDGRRLVLFFNNGVAREWTLAGDVWKGGADIINLNDRANILTLGAMALTPDASRVVLIPGPQKTTAKTNEGTPKLPSVPDGFCFDINRPDWQKPIRLREFGNASLNSNNEVHASERWLLAPDPMGGLIGWELESADASKGVPPRHMAGSIAKATMLPDGRLLSFESNSVRFLDLGSQSAEKSAPGPLAASPLTLQGIPQHPRLVEFNQEGSVMCSQEGRWLVVGGKDGALRAWNLNPLSISVEPFVYWDSSPSCQFLFSPDRRLLVLSLPDGALRILDLTRPDPAADIFRIPPSRLGPTSDLIQSDDGRFLLAVHAPFETAELWPVPAAGTKAAIRCELKVGKKSISGFKTDPQAAWIAVQTENAAGKPQALLWKTASLPKTPGAEKAEPAPANTILPGRLVTFLPGENQALTVGDDNHFYLWTLQAGKSVSKSPALEISGIQSTFATPKGDKLLAAIGGKRNEGATRELWLLDSDVLQKGQTPKVFASDDRYWTVWGISDDGKRAFLSLPTKDGKGDRPMCLPLDRDQTSLVEFFAGNGEPSETTVKVIAKSSNRRWLLTQNTNRNDAIWHLWDLNQKIDPAQKIPSLSPALSREFDSAVFSSDSAWLVTTREGRLRVFDLRADSPGLSGKEHEFSPNSLRIAGLSADGRWLAVVDQEYATWIWDRHDKSGLDRTILPKTPISFEPLEMVWSADGKIFTIGSYSLFGKTPVADNAARNDVLSVSRVNIDDLRLKVKGAVGRNTSAAEWDSVGLKDPHDLVSPMKFGKTIDESLPVPSDARRPARIQLYQRQLYFHGVLSDMSKKFHDKRADEHKFSLKAGTTYFIEMASNDFDSYLLLADQNGKILDQAYDDNGQSIARIKYHCETSGDYKIIATGFGTGKGKYEATVRAVEPMKTQPSDEKILVKEGVLVETKVAIVEKDRDLEDGPGKIFELVLPAGKICQIDLASPNHLSALILESDGKILATSIGSGAANARILFSTQKAAYRIAVAARMGTLPADMRLRVRLQ